MAEENPYRSPQAASEQPQPHVMRRFGLREAVALVLWICWTIGLLMGLLFAVHYFGWS
jgi:hypothetical protein